MGGDKVRLGLTDDNVGISSNLPKSFRQVFSALSQETISKWRLDLSWGA
jgi:hypothetical protein